LIYSFQKKKTGEHNIIYQLFRDNLHVTSLNTDQSISLTTEYTQFHPTPGSKRSQQVCKKSYNIYGRNYRVLWNISPPVLTILYHKSHTQSICKLNIRNI